MPLGIDINEDFERIAHLALRWLLVYQQHFDGCFAAKVGLDAEATYYFKRIDFADFYHGVDNLFFEAQYAVRTFPGYGAMTHRVRDCAKTPSLKHQVR